VVKRIVGSDDILVAENWSKTGAALLTIRERGHLGQLAVWAILDLSVSVHHDENCGSQTAV
jgi:hypothetical protein